MSQASVESKVFLKQYNWSGINV